MTARALAAPSGQSFEQTFRPGRGRLVTLLALLLVAALHGAAWFAWNRPVSLPDWRGQVNGFAFAPYQRGQSAEDGDWPTAEQIAGDLRTIAPLTRRIRTYTVDGGFDRIPAIARQQGLDLRVTLGAWLDGRAEHDAAELKRLATAARDRNVEMLMVGNEAVLRGDLTPAKLAADIRQLRAMGVRQPISTAEPWHVWLKHPELAQAVDVITIHLLPYWEGLPVQDALRFTMEKYQAVAARFPGKRIVIGEVGWPSDGRDIGVARASRVNQAAFLRGFFAEAEKRHLDYFVMEAFDQPWKVSFEGRAAGHWGMFDLDRVAKWPLAGAVQETPAWPFWAAGATLFSFLATLLLLNRRPDIRLPGKLLLGGLAQVFTTGIAVVLLTMAGSYLTWSAAAVWGTLLLGQMLLLVMLLADGFELAETVWGRVWKRRLAPPADAPLPKVSIHLPICNEPPHMVRQTLDALAGLDYPDFEVLVIDNNTMDPALWEPVAQHCARLGARFRFFHLGRWPGFKAGALNFALRQTAPDAAVIGVIDSDYMVSPDWLRRMVPYFADPKVGFTQNPQDYRDGQDSAFKRLMFWEYAGFFQAGMVTRNERNAIIQHGTMTLVRREALRLANGWAEWCICEDSELGLKLFRHGWEAVYVPESMGRGVMPDDFAAWRKQRLRWAYGAVQILKRHGWAVVNPFRRELSLGQRWHFATGWAPWFGDALGLVFVVLGLVWSAGLILAPVRTEFPILLFMAPSLGLFLFKLGQIWALYAARVPCGWRDRLGAALAGLALTHTIGKAVILGIFTKRLPFIRTPKLADAPALLRGLGMAWQELVLATLLWLAAAGVTLVHKAATAEAVLWTLVLLVQSVPYLASVAVSLVAAWPAKRRVARPVAASLALRQG